MLDLYENNSYEVLKRTSEDRSAWRESTRKKVPKTPAVQLKKKEESLLLYNHNYQHKMRTSHVTKLLFPFISNPLITHTSSNKAKLSK